MLDAAFKKFLVALLVILVGGGIVSLVLGRGFWGEKPATVAAPPLPPNWGTYGPNMSSKCQPGVACAKCHPDK